MNRQPRRHKSPRPSPSMRARRDDDGFKTRIPRPSIRDADARDASTRETTSARSDVDVPKKRPPPLSERSARNGAASTPKRPRASASRELTIAVAPSSCARSGSTIAVRAETTREDDALEALLREQPRGKDKFDKVGKARACDEYLGRLRPAVREMMGRMMDARVELANVEGRHERMTEATRARAENAERERDAAEARWREATREQERAEEAVKEAEKAARASERARVEAARVTREAEGKAEAARAEAEDADARADGLREDVERLERQIEGLERNAREASAETARVAEENATLREEKSKLTMEVGTLRGEKSGLEMDVEGLRREASERVAEREAMREKTDRLHNELAKTRAEKDGSSQAMTRALEDAVEARSEAARRASEADAALERARRAEEAHAQALSDLQRARSERNDARETVDALTAEIELLKPQLAATEEKLKTVSTRADDAERDARAIKSAKERVDEKCAELTETVRAAEQRVASQTERANASELESARLHAELVAARASKDALDPKLSKLGNELADARAEARELKHEKERMANEISSLKHSVVSLEGAKASAQSKLETATMEKAALDERFNAETSARREIQDELSHTKTLLSKANQCAADERAKAAAARDAVDDAEAARRQLDALQRAHETQGDELARCKMELANIVNDERSTSQLIARLQEVKNALAAREEELHQAMITRRHLHNAIQELKGNIRVFCRIRPPSADERAFDGSNLSIDRKGEFAGRRLEIAPPEAPKSYDFTFDRVFAANGDQKEVFDEVSLLVQSALDGYKVCIFTYGQTGSGKTYTMLGGAGDARGLIPRSMEQIFSSQASLESKGMKVSITATLLEIYNEDIRDLLSDAPDAKKEYKIKHDDEGNTRVTNLCQVEVFSAGEVEALMRQANAARAVAKTNMNDRSSRSHMVMRLCLDGVNEAGEPIHGALNLVDLAGSERLSRTGATGDRLKEAQAINKSLSSLGDVILALANKEKHVPFRNSKLTYLLKNSLGGDCKTLMLVNVSPSLESAQETICSLRFASKVNACALRRASAKSSSTTTTSKKH